MLTEGGVTAPKGFTAGSVHCGIKKNSSKNDLAVILSEKIGNAAAVYTQNKVFGAPITVTREHIKDGRAQLFICNSGNANTCNKDGLELANKMSELIADKIGIAKEDVIIASTGVIGQSLPIEKIAKGISAIKLHPDGSVEAAEAIMTTDLVIKEVAVEFEIEGKLCKIGAIAKGSGMIAPNMATMLAFITTDVAISTKMLEIALKKTVEPTYNMVDVDGDTSTNDMVAIIANGLAANKEISEEDENFATFVNALLYVNLFLAKKIAKDGEGASKLLTVHIVNAQDDSSAKKLAKAVLGSSLVKTAVYGNDANWGRILCALGYADVDFNPDKVSIKFQSRNGEILICEDGSSVMFDESVATHVLNDSEITIWVDMHQSLGSAMGFGCDLTEKYVDINASYRS
ncbi:MAG: bifunctional ornithine acetyltransferase/N-acetylglutamate synthase [Candidatus Epulonipiscioides saccharophilum]|nr:MAG: bifunctional ornithine acetyltransferase/N-acetylglutamate synthase [Epulopiscium sp. AS2M-Bin001]